MAQDLYNAMVSAGFADATFDGTNITSFNDPTGAETTDASLYFTATGGPVIGDTEELAPVIVVPQRYME